MTLKAQSELCPLPASRERELKAGEIFKEGSDCPEVVVVPAGEFMMGSPQDEEGHGTNENPLHKVIIARAFAVGRFAVTVGEYRAFVRGSGHAAGREWQDPGFPQDSFHPVTWVSWDDAKAYVAWLSSKTAKDYRLLSEAEWEYVARAGTATPFWCGLSISAHQANYDCETTYGDGKAGRYRGSTVPVASFAPNPWGLYQVHGNVCEWVEDGQRSHGSYRGAPCDGSAWTTGFDEIRICRGGGWGYEPRFIRSASRGGAYQKDRHDDIGFRVARTLSL